MFPALSSKNASVAVIILATFFLFSPVVRAVTQTCSYSCARVSRYADVVCASTTDTRDDAAVSAYFSEHPGASTYSLNGNSYFHGPRFYVRTERRTRSIEVPENGVCTTLCAGACRTDCGDPAQGIPANDRTLCLLPSNATPSLPVDSSFGSFGSQCRRLFALPGAGLPDRSLLVNTDATVSATDVVPSCRASEAAANGSGAVPSSTTGATCNPPAIPENAPPKKCVFYCMQPGTGSDGNGRATVETGSTGGDLIRGVGGSAGVGSGAVQTTPDATCVNVNVVRRVGARACSSEGECACVEECKSVCGSEGGKSRCFIAPNHPDQLQACRGAGTISQARPPKCEVPADAVGSSRTLDNPLHTEDIGELIARFIRALSGIAGAMALLMFVVGGVIWMTAEGSDRVSTAQTILKNASIGLILIFFAYSIVSLFLSVLGL